jgi:hypothetical protein
VQSQRGHPHCQLRTISEGDVPILTEPSQNDLALWDFSWIYEREFHSWEDLASQVEMKCSKCSGVEDVLGLLTPELKFRDIVRARKS